MRTRLVAAAIAVVLTGVSVGLWRGLASRESAADQIDCNIQAPLPPCAGATEPQLGDLVVNEPKLASTRPNDGTLASIRFAPKAAASDITEFLVANSISVVDGPKSGGLYIVRLPETGKKKTDLIKRIAVETQIVDFIAAVQ